MSDGNPATPKRGRGRAPPKFSAHVYCGQTAGWMKLVLGIEVGLNPGDFVLDGDPVPFPQKGAETPPQFSAHFYCGQTAACIKMPLGMELGLRPDDFVLDGDPVAPPQKGGRTPQIFGPCLLRPNGWMDEAGTWHSGRPHRRRVCVRWGPNPLPQKRQSPLPNFKGFRLKISKLDRKWGHFRL